jgi:gas vesicle protein
MTNERNGMMAVLISFFTGCLVGGTAGLLYAPQSGTRTRRQIGNFAADVREIAGEVTENAIEAIQKVIERGRSLVNA